MAEPELDPVAAHVRRYDPALFRTALLAPEPGRGRLMTLYAFDIELSRALSRSHEPMISLMRLQWWRDCLQAIRQGEPPRAHEVAGPLHALLTERPLPQDLLEGLVEAREVELEGMTDAGSFGRWAEVRFAGLIQLAAGCLLDASGPPPSEAGSTTCLLAEVAEPAGRAMAAAFALRTAAPMAAAGGRCLVPGVGEQSLAALARGRTDAALAAVARELAERALAELARARRRRSVVPAAARPAFLPLGIAAPVLRRAALPGVDLADLATEGAGPGTTQMLWRVLTGRW